MMHLYEVKLIHRVCDWDCSFTWAAPDAKTARRWVTYELSKPDDWLIVSAKRKTK